MYPPSRSGERFRQRRCRWTRAPLPPWGRSTCLRYLLRRFASFDSRCCSRSGDPEGGTLRMWSVIGFIVAVQHSSPRPGAERKSTWNGRSVLRTDEEPLRAPGCLRQRGRGSSRPGPPPGSRTAPPAPFAAARECPYLYTERPDSGCVNSMNQDDFPRAPVPSRSRIGVCQRLAKTPPPRSLEVPPSLRLLPRQTESDRRPYLGPGVGKKYTAEGRRARLPDWKTPPPWRLARVIRSARRPDQRKGSNAFFASQQMRDHHFSSVHDTSRERG